MTSAKRPAASGKNSSPTIKAPSKNSAAARPAPRGGLSKDRILAVATKMFATRGFAAISIRDIAGECGISIPSIYHFYGDKESLYDACYKATFEAAANNLRAAMLPGSSAEARVELFVVKLCELLLRDDDFRRLFQRELLREERRLIDKLTTHHFTQEFKLLTADIVALSGAARSIERAFSIYALTFGLIQMRRIGEFAGMDSALAQTPEQLARHVLGIVLPSSFSDLAPAPAKPVKAQRTART